MSLWIAAALGSMLMVGAPSAPSAPPDDGTTVEGVVVTARPTPEKEAIAAFVDSLSLETAGGRLGRWDRKICSGVLGFQPAYAQAMNDRIARTALSVGLEVGEPGCKADIIVIGTPDSDKLTRDLVKDYPNAFAKYEGELRRSRKHLKAFVDSDAPVRWWHVTRRTMADGQKYDAGASVPVRGIGRLRATTREDFDRVIIVLDVKRIGTVRFGALADYVAMVGLAQIDPETDTAGVSSLLNLFSDRAVGATPPQTLTEWDQAYLRGLYEARRDGNNSAAQERDMVRSIGDSLGAAPKDEPRGGDR